MKRIALTLTLTPVMAGIALATAVAAAPADADPLNPRDPDYCGGHGDVFVCSERRSTYPNEGESIFLTDVRGRIPGTDARHLAAGRGVCLELASGSTGQVVGDVARYLRTSTQMAEQVVGAAKFHICP